MQFPERSKKLEWNFNTIVTIIGIVSGLIVTSAGWGVTYADMRNDNKDLQKQISDINTRLGQEANDRKDRLKAYQDQLSAMQQQIAQIAPLAFQTTRATEAGAENKKAIELTNTRIDRVVESLGGKLDTAIDSINKVSTQVQVLSSKFEDSQGKPEKSIFRTPIVRP